MNNQSVEKDDDEKLKLQLELLELLQTREQEIKYNKLATLFPDTGHYRRELYPKHISFMNASSQFSQLAFIAANRIGKTLTGATLMAYHLTGRYPSWYTGRRFLNPVKAWAASKRAQDTKEIIQFELLGELDDIGTGTIPKEYIVGNPTRVHSVPEAVDTIRVRHISGGISKVTLKSYEQKREGFMGTYRHFIWLDEEPSDPGIFEECLIRTMNDLSPGVIICTFTPLFGLSKVVMSFLPGGKFPLDGKNPNDPSKFVVQVSWDEVPHLSAAQKEEKLRGISPHLRAARSKGIPYLGSGSVYPYLEEDFVIRPNQLMPWWPRVYALDVGWNRTAVLWAAIDPESKIVYIYAEYYMGQELPPMHASAIKARGAWIPGVIDPSAKTGKAYDGTVLMERYQEEGLVLEPADNALEAGITDVRMLFEQGLIKVWDTLENFLVEMRVYRRDENGKIIEEKNKKDHLMDCVRYLVRSGLRLAVPQPEEDFGNNIYNKDTFGDKGVDDITGY